MSPTTTPLSAAPEPHGAILVSASPNHALELLRWATLRSDDVLFVAPTIAPAARLYASRFAIEVRERAVRDVDFAEAAAILLSLDDRESENAVIRQARKRGIAVHVRDRPLVSDFTVLAMMEHPWLVQRAA